MDSTRYSFALLLASLLSTSVAATEVYRWTDADGVVNYGPRKPSEHPAQRVTITHDNENSEQARAKLDRMIKEADLDEAARTKGEQQRQETAASKAADADRRRACVTAAHNLEKLQNWAKHILVDDGSGTPTTMDSLHREAAIKRVRDWMSANNCP